MIIIKGLEFYGFHGVPDEEQIVGHRYSIDLEIEGLFEAEYTDRIAETINYGDVCKVVLEIAQKQQVRTIERLTRIIGETLLESYTMIESLNIILTKKLPPAPYILESASYQQLFIRD